MLQATFQKNDKQAKWFIGIFSLVVFAAVVILGKVKLDVTPGFDIHIFATLNAFINATIAVLLLAALVAVKGKRYQTHKNIMIAALILSIIFLVSYIAHHLLAGEAIFGDSDHDGNLSAAEKAIVGSTRTFYIIILLTHIFLAAIILPFILFTAYRALTGEWKKHKKIARYTWPLWFYVAVTGPVVYWMISPYYR
jgi:putative membrane protein